MECTLFLPVLLTLHCTHTDVVYKDASVHAIKTYLLVETEHEEQRDGGDDDERPRSPYGQTELCYPLIEASKGKRSPQDERKA